MPWCNRWTLGLAVFVCVPCVSGAEPEEEPWARVELRWVENERVEGLTVDEGVRFSCGEELSYPHTKPALAVTAAAVDRVQLTHHDFSASGLSSENYTVTIHLTQASRDTLAAAYEGDGMRLLTIVVDGHYWGLYRYEKGGNFVPERARAESFTPDVGFFSSREDAQRVVDALQ
jgi:hypothetical protein